MGCQSFSRGIFPTQGPTPLSLSSACISQAGSLPLAPPGKPPVGLVETSTESLSVVCDSLRPRGLYMDSPGHSTGVGGRSFSQGLNPGLPPCRRILYQLSQQGSPAAAAAAAESLQSSPTLCDPIDGSPPGSPIPRILQARTLEWVAISFSNAEK